MPRFQFQGDMHVSAQVWIEADTLKEAVKKAEQHDTFDDYDLSERPQWFVWNGDVITDEDDKELTSDDKELTSDDKELTSDDNACDSHGNIVGESEDK